MSLRLPIKKNREVHLWICFSVCKNGAETVRYIVISSTSCCRIFNICEIKPGARCKLDGALSLVLERTQGGSTINLG